MLSGARYYTFEITDFRGDNFAYVGTRVTGDGAGHYAIAGPDWAGDLPDGVIPLPRSATDWAFVFGRTLVNEPDDLPVVHAIQDQYLLRPLSVIVDPTAEP